jgi:uncharacterized OB-fold protein
MTVPVFDPPPSELGAPFWKAVDAGQLVLPRCSVCGEWQWYPETSGTECAGGRLVWEPVASTGAVYSFTRVHRSFLPGGREHVPYVVGLVDVDGVDGPRLVATLDGDTDWRVGDRVEVAFESVVGRMHPVFRRVAEEPQR